MKKLSEVRKRRGAVQLLQPLGGGGGGGARLEYGGGEGGDVRGGEGKRPAILRSQAEPLHALLLLVRPGEHAPELGAGQRQNALGLGARLPQRAATGVPS